MKRKRYLWLILCLVLSSTALISCNSKEPEAGNNSKTEELTRSDSDDWTVLIYMCGSDLESKNAEASKNISEMLSASMDDNVNIIIQTGGAKKWFNENISPASTDRYLIQDKEMTLLERDPKQQNFGDYKTLVDFVKFGIEKYPAKKTALILWNHGAGSLDGVCFDENFQNDCLTLSEIKTALDEVNLKNKLEFIGFDACLMANFETAYLMKSYANNMIASEELEPNAGWDYKALIENLNENNFYSKILDSYAAKSADTNYYTLSHIKLDKLDVITDAFLEMITKMYTKPKDEVVSSIRDANALGKDSSNLYDLGDLFKSYGIDCKLSDVIKLVSATDTPNGISIWFPLMSAKKVEKYVSNNPYEPYSMYIKNFYNNIVSDKIALEGPAYNKDNKLAFTLKESSMEYVGDITYMLLSIAPGEAGDNIYALGVDNDVSVDKNNVTVNFGGRWVRINNQWLYCVKIDQIEDTVTFQSPVMVDSREALLIFTYNTKSHNVDIQGVTYYDSEIASRMYDLKDGSQIILMTRKIVDDDYVDEYDMAKQFVYNHLTTPLEVATLPDSYYQYSAFVTDVYGNHFNIGTALVEMKNGEVTLKVVTNDSVTYPH